jgi:hypothetical protein
VQGVRVVRLPLDLQMQGWLVLILCLVQLRLQAVVEVDLLQRHCQQQAVLVEVMVAIPQLHQQLLAHLVKDLQGVQALQHHQRHLAVLVVGVVVQLEIQIVALDILAQAVLELYQQLRAHEFSTLVVAVVRHITLRLN